MAYNHTNDLVLLAHHDDDIMVRLGAEYVACVAENCERPTYLYGLCKRHADLHHYKLERLREARLAVGGRAVRR